MGKPVIHFEFWTEEANALSKFYRDVFDWKIEHVPQVDYHVVDTGAGTGINGGIFTPDRSGPWPAKLAFYIDVDDLDAYGERIRKAGGKLIVEKQEVPGMGAFTLFEDPDGRVLGIWKVKPRE